MIAAMQEYQLTFIDLALGRNALRFGKFTLKSGRESPYFFNAGLFDDGEALAVLGQCYAAALQRSGLEYDMLFGPAYKGIPLVASTAVALAESIASNPPQAVQASLRTVWAARDLSPQQLQSLGNLFLTKAMTVEALAEGQAIFTSRERGRPRTR